MTWETFLAATTPATVAAPSRSLILAYFVFVVALILRGWCLRKRGRRGSPEMVDYHQQQDEEASPPPTLSSNGPAVALPWAAKSRYKQQMKSRTPRAGSPRRARHLVPPLPNSSKMFSPRKRPRHLKRIKVAQRMVVTRTLTVREAVEMDSETVGWIRQGSVVYVIEACDTEHLFMAGSLTSRRVDSARGPKSSFYSGQGCRGAAPSRADSSTADSSTIGPRIPFRIHRSGGSHPPPSAPWLRLPIRLPSETRRAYVAIASGLPALGWVTAVNAMGVETLQSAETLQPAEMLQPAACGCSDTKDAACAMCHCASRRNDALGDVSFLPASNDALGDVSFLPASMLRDRLLYLRGVTLSPRVFRGGSSPSSPQPRQPGLAPRERMHELMWGSPAPERPTQLL